MLLLSHFNRVQLFVTPWTVAHQAPLSLGFSRQEYWSGLPRPPLGDLPNPVWNPRLLRLLHCRQILYHWAIGEALNKICFSPNTLPPTWSIDYLFESASIISLTSFFFSRNRTHSHFIFKLSSVKRPSAAMAEIALYCLMDLINFIWTSILWNFILFIGFSTNFFPLCFLFFVAHLVLFFFPSITAHTVAIGGSSLSVYPLS